MASNFFDDVTFDAEPMNRNVPRQPAHEGNSTRTYNIDRAENLVIDGTINYYQLAPKKRNGWKVVGIVWDILTCPVLPGKSTLDLITKMRTRFITEGYREEMFICLCDVKNQSAAIIQDLYESNVKVRPAVKNEIFDKLKESIKQFAEGGVSGKRLAVISNYVNFDDLLSYIKTTKLPDVVLVHKDVASKAVLEYSDADHFQFSELTSGLLDIEKREAKISHDPIQNVKQNGGDEKPSNETADRTVKKNILDDTESSNESLLNSDGIVTDAEPERGTDISPEFTFSGDGLNHPKNWTRGRHIGSGGFGKVYEVEDSPHYRKVAVKQVKECQQDSKKEKDALLMELKILKKLRHPKIVKYYGFCEAEGVLSLFMERIMGGSLEDYLKDEAKSQLETSRISAITRQMLEGVSYLHSNRTIHRDIKSGNVLMDEHFQIKLADFGVSRVFQELSKATTKHIGTTRWMAPERIYSDDYSYEVDIWAVGCTVIEMVTRRYPFHNLKEEQNVMFRLVDPQKNPSPAYDLPETCPKDLRDFFADVFQKDVSQRPTANDLLSSNPFVIGNN